MVKIHNKRNSGSLFHYAHFLCDCLYPEVINKVQRFDTIHRLKSLEQTLGNFSKMYEDVMQNKSVELNKKRFDEIKGRPIVLPTKNAYKTVRHMNIFRNYIFKRYNIKPNEYLQNSPKVILVKRGKRVPLIKDPILKSFNKNVTNGAERREIEGIHKIEQFLQKKYPYNFEAVYLEEKTFEEQVALFNNAKLIVLAHGAAMSNMFFCKKDTKIVEVTCNKRWPFFDVISSRLKLKHIKIHRNEPNRIINIISKLHIKLGKSKLPTCLNIQKIQQVEKFSIETTKIHNLMKTIQNPMPKILELGFSNGHIANAMLSFNPVATITSFDECYTKHSQEQKRIIDSKYPNRHKLILGKSEKVIPKFINDNTNIKFDIIVINNVENYNSIIANLENSVKVAHKDAYFFINSTIFKNT